MRRLLILCALAACMFPVGAQAATSPPQMRACQTLVSDDGLGGQVREKFGKHWTCGTVTVPQRRADGTGTIKLRVAYYHRPGPQRRTLVGLAGGPGQGAFQYSLVFADTFKALLPTNDLLVFDQRGTGGSGYLNFEKCVGSKESKQAYDRCAQKLGGDRYTYKTSDTVADIEDIRVAFGIPQVLPIGVSYGTKVAGDYARAYPQSTAAVVLDSPLAPTGLDPWMRDSLAASARLFDQVCQLNACPFTKSARADFITLLARTRANGSLTARVPWGKGGTKRLSFTQEQLLEILFNADFSPAARLQLPGLIYDAVNGDRVPLVRYLGLEAKAMKSRQLRKTGYITTTGRAEKAYPDSSDLLYVATTCTDSSLPWVAGASRKTAERATESAFKALDSNSFFGWNKNAVRGLDVYDLCALFGNFGGTVQPQLPYPTNVPTLVIVGTDDIRTTVENAQAYAPLGATVLPVPRSGHSVLTSGSPCAKTALTAFANGAPVVQCQVPTKRVLATTPIKQRTTQLPGAFQREIVTGIADTILGSYQSNQIELFDSTRSGLRGGWFTFSGKNDEHTQYHRYRFYKDLSITGKTTFTSRSSIVNLRFSGRTSGTVTARVQRDQTILVVKFAGQTVRYNLSKHIADETRVATVQQRDYKSRSIAPPRMLSLDR